MNLADKWDMTVEFVNMWGCWMKLVESNMCYTIEIDENVKREVKFVTLLNMWDCWMNEKYMWWEYNWICDIQLNWHCWIEICGMRM